MKDFNKENEKKVIEDMLSQLREMPNLFDYEMQLNNTPQLDADGHYFNLRGDVYLLYNSNTQLYNEIVFNTLSSLSLSEEEYKECKKLGIPIDVFSMPEADNGSKFFKFYLRNELDERILLPEGSGILLFKSANNYIISDNISSPTDLKYTLKLYLADDDTKDPLTFYKKESRGLLKDIAASALGDEFVPRKYVAKERRKIGDIVGHGHITIKIPKDDIGKYSNFRIEPALNSQNISDSDAVIKSDIDIENLSIFK